MNPAVNQLLAIAPSGLTYIDSAVDAYASNVKALLHFDGANAGTTFGDAKGNTFAATGAVTTSTTRSKYGAASALFPANTYIQGTVAGFAPGTGDFTVEGWFYQTAFGRLAAIFTSGVFFGMFSTSGGALRIESGTSFTGVVDSANSVCVLNTWQHLAVSRVSGVSRAFVDGVLVASVADTRNYTGTNFDVGDSAGFAGNAEEVRLTVGTGRYVTSFTVPTTPFPDGLTDASFSSVKLLMPMQDLVDVKGKTITNTGSVAIDTAIKKFGNGSASFNGSSQTLSPAASADFLFAGDFTIEMWINVASGVGANAGIFNINGLACQLQTASTGLGFTWYTSGSTWVANANAPAGSLIGRWTHIAMVRIGTAAALYVDGAALSGGNATTISGNFGSSSVAPVLGQTSGGYFKGNIQDVRVTNGVGRYTGTFTPPAYPHPLS